MIKRSTRLGNSAIVRRLGLIGALVGALVVGSPTLPAIAQQQQQHHPTTHTNQHSSNGKSPPHYTSMSQSQMANMLDDVTAGKSPTLPIQANTARHLQTGMTGVRPTTNIVRPPAGGMLRANGMGQGMPYGGGQAMSHGMGMARGPGMGSIGHGMMPMGTMGGGGGGMRSSINPAGAAQFMQAFKQKFGALMPAEGAGGGESGEGAESGGMPSMPGGMPGGGGGGMQAQLMQRLFQGQAPGGAAPGGPMGGMGGMGGMPGAMGGMPLNRPSARGMGMGMPTMPQVRPRSSQGDVIRRPPGVAGITGGAPATSPNRGASSSSASDLERQMEQQYGR